ncbi:uncharacterized protein Z520_12064 [Fonsecaea multimorphosa CBS 102226]|uniref:Uncharacterized protein n=1 Tax=Fonsecaea multimorphosa CBS 102226 TaxID=1442371 RepID=A0A0D2K766_9EURO|nr:uncharacterized protein Z520_12064 [Fonsecaea multimorphosa CBS 102226]KIX92183.1 hypothetical protein Z520_12064 [Fonsecaea multimorphosa CBS 102226]
MPKYMAILVNCQALVYKNAQGSGSPKIYLSTTRDAVRRLLVPVTHFHISLVGSQRTKKEGTLIPGQGLGCLQPVRNGPEGDDGNHDGSKSFEDEDPAPRSVPSDAIHVTSRRSKESGDGASQDQGRRVEIEASLKVVTFVEHAG